MEAALCALHPDTQAVAHCSRCGRFMCPPCIADEATKTCTACLERVLDPYGLKSRAFEVVPVFREGVKLARSELPKAMLISLLFALPAAYLQLKLVGDGDDLKTLARSVRVTRLYDAFVGIIGAQAMLALFIARAEGRVLSVGAALREGFTNWPRVFAAKLKAGLLVLGFALLLVVPGIWKSVLLAFVGVGALRRRGDALDRSEQLVRGRWWEVFGFLALAGVVLYLPMFVLAVVLSLAADAAGIPAYATEVLSDWIGRVVDDGFVGAQLLVAYYALHKSAGIDLEPMEWKEAPPLVGPPPPSH